MNLFDSHAHVSSSSVLLTIDEIIERARGVGVKKILNICTDLKTLEEGEVLQTRFPEILNAGATTPHDVEKEGEEVFPFFERAAREKRLVAVGETGLDYYYKELNPKIQKQFLVRYLHLAAECNLPVIFHCREAFKDLFEVVDAEYPKEAKAVLHCFTGTLDEAKKVIDRGWYLSLSGIVTFKKSEELRKIAEIIPIDQLLIETDTPYLAPQTKRGKPNEPAFIYETCECVAKVKGKPVETIAQATYQNAELLFCKK